MNTSDIVNKITTVGGGKSVTIDVMNPQAYRKEVSRLSSLANKRLVRLEKGGLTDSPAYSRWVDDGKVKFGVKNKSYNDLQKEMSRLKRFINSNTSTVRGINNTLKDMAKNTGIKYNNIKDLRAKSSKFFELSSKVEQYLRTVEDMASAIGYNKIWEVINEYVQVESVNLGSAETNIDDLVSVVSKILAQTPKGRIDKADSIGGGWIFIE